MRIEVLSVENNTLPGKKPGTSYQQLNVAYKNLSQGGKVEGKKIMSFGDTAKTFEVLSASKHGDVFEVDNQKKGDYWVWLSASAASGEAASAAPVKGATPAPKSNYETAEERARRQVLIVRQSSLSAAVDSLKIDKAPLDGESVVKLAEYYVDFVFERGLFTKEAAPARAADFEDDIPF